MGNGHTNEQRAKALAALEDGWNVYQDSNMPEMGYVWYVAHNNVEYMALLAENYVVGMGFPSGIVVGMGFPSGIAALATAWDATRPHEAPAYVVLGVTEWSG